MYELNYTVNATMDCDRKKRVSVDLKITLTNLNDEGKKRLLWYTEHRSIYLLPITSCCTRCSTILVFIQKFGGKCITARARKWSLTIQRVFTGWIIGRWKCCMVIVAVCLIWRHC